MAPQPGASNANAPNGANPSQAAPEAPRGLKGSGLRYTEADGVPSWAIGKTADEILRMTQTLSDTVARGTPAAPPASAPPPAAPGAPRRVNSDLVYRDADAYTNEILGAVEHIVNERLGAASGALTAPVASMARAQAMSHKPDIWAKYGPEIDALMAEVQGPARLNVDLWKRAVNMVASDHIDEIARERAESLIRSGDSGMLSGGVGTSYGSPASPASPVRALFAANDPAILPFKEAGLDAAAVIAHYAKMGKDEARAAETIKNAASRRVRSIA